MSEYGERIRQIREALGLSQSDFAERLGIHKQMVSDVERGKQKRFNAQIEKSLVDLFGVDLSWLLYGQGEMFAQESSYSEGLKKQEDVEKEMIVKYFDRIPPQKRLEATLCILECIRKYLN